jgi:hypothetical protein
MFLLPAEAEADGSSGTQEKGVVRTCVCVPHSIQVTVHSCHQVYRIFRLVCEHMRSYIFIVGLCILLRVLSRSIK